MINENHSRSEGTGHHKASSINKGEIPVESIDGYKRIKSKDNVHLYQAHYVPNQFIIIDAAGKHHTRFGYHGRALFNALARGEQ